LAENPDINIMVEGHTDNVPMHGSGEVKDNWDLSVMRATAVTKILTENKQIDPVRIIAAGRSEYLPLSSDDTAEGRQMNRRTEIILTPKLDELLKIIDTD
jgi:chemotaxis protein MotB